MRDSKALLDRITSERKVVAARIGCAWASFASKRQVGGRLGGCGGRWLGSEGGRVGKRPVCERLRAAR